MSIINNSHAIGVDTRNLVLKTRGTLHIKVGDRYYEIDFRNLNANSEDKEEQKEEYIISIDSKDQIEQIEYPGDNKLIVGLDGSLFVTKNNSVIDVTPKQTSNKTTTVAPIQQQVTKSGYIENKLFGDSSLSLDFVNSSITTDTLVVSKEMHFPGNTITNKCCKTYKRDDVVQIEYLNYDFIELVEIPEKMSVKSGVMIKSSVDAEINMIVNQSFTGKFKFEKNGLYIIYEQNQEIIQTKLN